MHTFVTKPRFKDFINDIENVHHRVRSSVLIFRDQTEYDELYHSMIVNYTWSDFCYKVLNKPTINDAIFISFLNGHRGYGLNILLQYGHAERELELYHEFFHAEYVHHNFQVLQKINKSYAPSMELILQRFVPPKFNTLKEFDDYLAKRNQNVVFLLDGIEHIGGLNKRYTIQASLLQDLENSFLILYHNISAFVFVNEELTRKVIKENYLQFTCVNYLI